MTLATPQASGSRPSDAHHIVLVRFKQDDGSLSPKAYSYWAHAGWKVQVGDSLLVLVGGVRKAPVVTDVRTASHEPAVRSKAAIDVHARRADKVSKALVPGDWVYVTAKALHPDFDWVSTMDTSIGRCFKIKAMLSDGAFELSNGYAYARESLVKIDDNTFTHDDWFLTDEGVHVVFDSLYNDDSIDTVSGIYSFREIRKLPTSGAGYDKLHQENSPTPPTNKDTPMKIEITNATYVNGKNVDDMSDAQVFETIRNAEVEIASLEKIENKPRALSYRIDDLRQGITDLIALVDARTPKRDFTKSATE